MSNLINKYQKSHYKVEDFGRGKSVVAKARHRRTIKKKALREFNREVL